MSDPECIDLGAIRSTEGFFLLRDHVEEPFPAAPPAEAGWRFCSTYRGSTPSLRDAVLDLIARAERKIFITSFILGDEALIEALAAAARRLTGGIYVISGLNEQSLRRGLAELADRGDRGRTITDKIEAEKKRFMSLTNEGIAVRGHENCHAKFVVVDDAIAWVGSANLETRAFTHVGEVGVVLDDPQAVSTLARLFARMWLADCRYELPAFADAYRVAERGDRPRVPFAVPRPIVGEHASVVWTDDIDESDCPADVPARRASLRTSIHEVIGSARHHLLLASFNLNKMGERPDLLLEPVSDAIRRGVRVELFVRALNTRDRHRRQAGLFHDLGVHVLADDTNHAKAAVADDARGLLFSANFDADFGLDPGSGMEVGARLDNTLALTELIRYLRHAMNCATRVYVPGPTARQLHDGLDASLSPWLMPDELTVECDRETWREFAAATERGPVIWQRKQGKPVALVAETRRLHLQPLERSFRLELGERTSRSVAEELALMTRGAPADERRKYEAGICTAVIRRSRSRQS
jgi:phosphatidylserine/phosphatidylglycerophosphate/cardiolipin synthase-like enzyme